MTDDELARLRAAMDDLRSSLWAAYEPFVRRIMAGLDWLDAWLRGRDDDAADG